MDLTNISRDIVQLVQLKQRIPNEDIDSITESVENFINKKVVNVLEPNGVYEKGKYYEGFGVYIGIVDTYPFGENYYVRNHHFSVEDPKGTTTTKDVKRINKVFIREFKKS